MEGIQFPGRMFYTGEGIFYALNYAGLFGLFSIFKEPYICNMSTASKTIHEGRNVKRFREMLGMKQEALASALGEDWNQKKISLLESKESIEAPILEDVAKALKVPVDAIKNFDEEAALNVINNTFNDHAVMNGILYNPTFNPLDKVVELYERMIKEKDEKIASLEKLLEKK
jgi:transcriptional regulator with XRE-family HTH domain